MKKVLALTAAALAIAAGPVAARAQGSEGWHRGPAPGLNGAHSGFTGHDYGWDRSMRERSRMADLIDLYDANGDKRVTQDEIDKARKKRLKQFDENGDGELSLDEYEKLWLDAMHERMVRQFQSNDEDGDARITPEEFTRRDGKMVVTHDRNGDGALSTEDVPSQNDAGASAGQGKMVPGGMPLHGGGRMMPGGDQSEPSWQ